MPIPSTTIEAFTRGVHNLLNNEVIPKDAASASLNWLTRDGAVELAYGRAVIGDNAQAAGKSWGLHTGYKVDGTAVFFRKVSSKIQALVGTTWTDVITGMTEDDVTFTNYTSLAGAFVYIFSRDGIYKICTANPTSYVSLYDGAKNFKGYAFIDKGRSILWGREDDPTGLYGSHIDAQDSTVYTTVTAEATTSLTGSLAALSGVVTMTIASPCVVTLNGHGFIAGSTVVFSTTGALPTGVTAGTTYYVMSTGLTANAFQISATNGGSAINTSGSQSGVHTIPNKRTAFGVEITITSTGEKYTDDFNGVLTGSLGGTGTINYTTGAYTLSNSGVGTATYQWENSNDDGVTDFTKSSTRLAGEGFVVRQDVGGDAIMTVIELEGSYFSLKKRSCYRFAIDATDLNPDNNIFRKDIGVPSLRSAIPTGYGIIFMNTANPSRPILQILGRNATGDNFDTKPLFPHFKFANYSYDDCMLNNWDRYVIVGCAEETDENDRLLLCDLASNTVDPTGYGIRVSCKDNLGILYGGDPVSQTTYELFTGFDDTEGVITNYWDSRGEQYDSNNLKKVKKLQFMGNIDPDQTVEVYVSYDDDGFSLVGTILGSGTYVDLGNPGTIGSSLIGETNIGGGDDLTVNPYFMELKLRSQKFRKRVVRFVATGYGYFSCQQMTDFDIWLFEQRLPAKYRSKQNVSLSGTPDQ